MHHHGAMSYCRNPSSYYLLVHAVPACQSSAKGQTVDSELVIRLACLIIVKDKVFVPQ